MIVIHKIRWKNFLATGREWIEIALDTYKSTLFVGTNGAGKSTLLDAITFALFNKPFREVKKGQVVNTITKKDCVVECELTINGHQYLIRRGIKPNIFEIFIDGVAVPSQASATEFQTYLEKQILKMNYKAFTQVVMLGSALFVPFMKLKAAERREVVEDLLDLQIFSQMNVLLKSDIQNLDLDIQNHKTGIAQLEQKIDMIKKSNAALRQNNDAQIAERLEIIERYHRTMAYEQKRIEERQIELDNIPVIDATPLIKKNQQLNNLLVQANTQLTRLNEDVSFFFDNTVCPTCAQVISDEHKHPITDAKTREAISIKNAMSAMIDRRDAINKQIAEANQRAKDRKDISDQIWISQDQIRGELKLIQQYNIDIEKLRKPPAAVQSSMQEEADLDQLKHALEALQQERRIASYASILLKDGGIKAQVIKQYIPIFNELINRYLTSLDFFVDFHLDENFNETIRSRYRDEFTYNLFSEGQKMRIDLALMFTWRAIARQRSSIDVNILVMDEVFDSSLDDNGTDELLNLIRKLTPEDNVIVISHKGDKMTDKFERTLEFDLVKNFTQMKVA